MLNCTLILTRVKIEAVNFQVAQVVMKFFKGRREKLAFLLTRLKEIREKFENSKFFKDHEVSEFILK